MTKRIGDVVVIEVACRRKARTALIAARRYEEGQT